MADRKYADPAKLHWYPEWEMRALSLLPFQARQGISEVFECMNSLLQAVRAATPEQAQEDAA